MTSFKGGWPTLKDAYIAKNYLAEDELRVLNNLVSGYFDFAEIQAIRHVPMYMNDYIAQLDSVLSSTGQKLLDNAGSISYQKATDTPPMSNQRKPITNHPSNFFVTVKSSSSEEKRPIPSPDRR